MRLRLAPFALAFFTLTSCHRGDPIENRLSAVVKAVEARDAEDVAASLSERFQSESGENKAAVVNELRRYLFAYEKIDVSITEQKIARGDDRAECDFIAAVRGRTKTIGGLDQLLPSSSRLRFHLELEKEGRQWLITGGTWERVE